MTFVYLNLATRAVAIEGMKLQKFSRCAVGVGNRVYEAFGDKDMRRKMWDMCVWQTFLRGVKSVSTSPLNVDGND